MLSLSAAKDGVILPSEEDRKRIITQMKVRTTLKGDNSWIQQRRSESEDEQNHSMLRSPQRTRATAEKSPASEKTLSPTHRVNSTEQPSQREPSSHSALKSPSKKSPSASSPSGYLIRGVFMKTVDKTSPSHSAPNGLQKSATSASPRHFSQGYKMTTDEYKKLAPYNIKRELSDPGEVEPSVSADEQKKRTEAASSVLRRTANRERSYVLSAAKKSNGSPTQEALPFVGNRIVEEDDVGPRSRSQTVPASAWFNSRGKSNTNGERRPLGASAWNEPKMASAASSTSIDTASRSQASKIYEEPSSPFNHWSSPVASEKNDRNSQTTSHVETRRVLFSDDSWEARKPGGGINSQASEAPCVVSLEGSPENRSTSHYRNEDTESPGETYHPPTVGEFLHETEFGSPRSILDRQVEGIPREFKYQSPSSQVTGFSEHEPNTTETFSSFERETPQEAAYESPSDNEYKKVEAYLAKSGSWSSESSVSNTGTQNEPLRTTRRDESDLEDGGSSSISTESGIATPESQQGEPGSDSDTARLSRGVHSDTPKATLRMQSSLDNPVSHFRQRSATLSHLGHQSNNATRSSGTYLGGPSYLYSQRYTTNTLQPSHGYPSPPSSQASHFGSRVYFPFRDGQTSGSPRSHRVPFYKDASDTDVKSKGLLFVKESINSTEMSSSPRYNSRSLVDLSELEKLSRSSASYLNSSPRKRTPEDLCTYCGREIRNCAKITIDNLKICCHEYCFKCGICHKPMGDLLDKIFIHRDIVHCDKCYEKLF